MRLIRPLSFAGSLLIASHVSGQVTLNFDDLQLGNFGRIESPYGSDLDPHIDLNFRTLVNSAGAAQDAYLEFWNTGYGDLEKVAYSSRNGNFVAEIAFTADVGYAVNLISFDMAGYPFSDAPVNTVMRLVDASNNILVDFAANGPVAIQGDNNGPRHSTFTPDITTAGVLKLQWGTDWNVGIDNIQFQAVAIPEPSSYLLLGAGIVGLLARAWRKRQS